MAGSQRDALLIRSTIDLAHGLGMRVVAEGVEDAPAAAMLAGMGCDYAQGFFIARPMPLKELLRFLDDSNPADQTRDVQGGARDQSDVAGASRRELGRAGPRRA